MSPWRSGAEMHLGGHGDALHPDGDAGRDLLDLRRADAATPARATPQALGGVRGLGDGLARLLHLLRGVNAAASGARRAVGRGPGPRVRPRPPAPGRARPRPGAGRARRRGRRGAASTLARACSARRRACSSARRSAVAAARSSCRSASSESIATSSGAIDSLRGAQDRLRQAEARGDRQRVAASRHADEDAVGRRQRHRVELDRGVVDAGRVVGEELELAVVRRRER